jgi:hypothetical protein
VPTAADLTKKTVERSRRRRAHGHYCVQCRRPWALVARRDEEQTLGARMLRWIVCCRFCDYRRTHVVEMQLPVEHPLRAVPT